MPSPTAHVVRVGAVAAGLALCAGLAGCGGSSTATGKDVTGRNVSPSPGLETITPSYHPSPPLTVSPYPSSTASARRGNPPGEG